MNAQLNKPGDLSIRSATICIMGDEERCARVFSQAVCLGIAVIRTTSTLGPLYCIALGFGLIPK